MIKLSPDVSQALGAHPFDTLMEMQGDVYRQQGSRETLRIMINNKPYFIKRYRHDMLGAGAKSEWESLRLCETMGVSVPALKGFGARGMQSFVLMDAVVDAESVEKVTPTWHEKQQIIVKMAHIARALHQKEYYHRDFYICHFFWNKFDGNMTLIDLHRLFKPRFFKKHYQEKDLSALLFSSLDMHITQRDVFLFLKHYFKASISDILAEQSQLLSSCEKKAMALYRKAYHHDPRHVPWLSHRSDWPQQMGPFHHVYDLNGKLFESDACLRVLGQRRMVLSGMYDGQRVVVKFFRDKKEFLKNKISPLNRAAKFVHSLSEGENYFSASHKKVWHIIYPYLHGHAPKTLTKSLLDVMVSLHQHNLIQTDPHLDNFRISNGNIYVLDTASIQSSDSDEKKWNNLALFYSQWPRTNDALHLTMLPDYCAGRGEMWTSAVTEAFVQRLQAMRARGLKKWLAKTCRNATDFYAKSRHHVRVYAKRAFANVYTQTLFRFPNAYFHEGADFLKKGRSNTVIRVTIGQQDVVIKRFNLKSLLHFLKGLVRGSKAKRAWQNTQLCRALGVATPEPLAMIEKRFAYIPLTSYLVTSYTPGIRLDYMSADMLTHDVCEKMAQAIHDVFTLFASVHCYHGDLKASNWIWDGETMQLIDLDSLKHVDNKACFEKCHAKDKARFLANFDITHPLRAMLF